MIWAERPRSPTRRCKAHHIPAQTVFRPLDSTLASRVAIGRLGPCDDDEEDENHDEDDDGAPGWRTRRCKEKWEWQFCLWSPRRSPPIGAIGTPDGEDNDNGDDNAIGTPDGDYDITDEGADNDFGDDGT